MVSNVRYEDLKALDVAVRPIAPLPKHLAVSFRFNEGPSLNSAICTRMFEGFINLEIDFVSEKGLEKWSS